MGAADGLSAVIAIFSGIARWRKSVMPSHGTVGDGMRWHRVILPIPVLGFLRKICLIHHTQRHAREHIAIVANGEVIKARLRD